MALLFSFGGFRSKNENRLNMKLQNTVLNSVTQQAINRHTPLVYVGICITKTFCSTVKYIQRRGN